jgi:hypothetical protein
MPLLAPLATHIIYQKIKNKKGSQTLARQWGGVKALNAHLWAFGGSGGIYNLYGTDRGNKTGLVRVKYLYNTLHVIILVSEIDPGLI